MQERKNTILTVLYAIVSIGLLLFTYTQVDLSLSLSRVSIWQTIQKAFQYIGFYQRPFATGIYILLLLGLFFLYVLILWMTAKKKLQQKNIWKIIGIMSVILLFSYPAAFSYDIFNHIFTAKMILLYHQNPYAITPLQFSGVDPMLSYMRWTHLPNPYTPLWIFLTLPAYLLSFRSLLLSLWMIKVIPLTFYIFCSWAIWRILLQYKKEDALTGVVLFAFNPLVIIEVLVSAHNDIVMMGLALFAFWLSLEKKSFSSFFVLSLSIALKFMTVFLLPLQFIGWGRVKAIILMSIGLFLVLTRREFLPWYFLWILPFAALFPSKREVIIITSGISLGLLLRYAPVLYQGDYNPPVPIYQNVAFGISVGASIVIAILLHFIRPKKNSLFGLE